MNFAPLNKGDRATWRELITAPTPQQALTAVLLCLFSLFTICACEVPIVCMLFLFCAAAFYYVFTRSFFAVFLVALPGMLLFSLSAALPALAGNPLMLPAAYAALLLGSVTGAFLIIHNRKHPYLMIALPLAAALPAIFLTGAPLRALWVLIPSVLACVIAYCLLSCRAQTSSLILIAATLAAAGLAAWLAVFYLKGWSDPNPIVAFVEEFRAEYVALYERLLQTLAEQEGMLAEVQQLSLGITHEDLQNAAILLGNLLPGLYLALCAVCAFGMWRMLLRFLQGYGSLPRIPLRIAVLTVSPAAAILFCLSHVASVLANTAAPTLFGTVCLNLACVLVPALALVGFTSLLPRGKQSSCLSLMIAIGLLAMLWQRPDLSFLISAYFGAFHILSSRFLHRKGEK